MSRSSQAIFTTLLVVLVVAMIAPLRRGEALVCARQDKSEPKRAVVLGLPLGFYELTGADSSCEFAAIKSTPVGTVSQNHVFTSASLWFDLIAVGALLSGGYGLLERRGSA